MENVVLSLISFNCDIGAQKRQQKVDDGIPQCTAFFEQDYKWMELPKGWDIGPLDTEWFERKIQRAKRAGHVLVRVKEVNGTTQWDSFVTPENKIARAVEVARLHSKKNLPKIYYGKKALDKESPHLLKYVKKRKRTDAPHATSTDSSDATK
ncbi:hypothetical protein FRC14_004483 [Serendipita sp. 396]|nr:hypothetical protein FRC14_004483 [Serendipita sp. 396]KAG8781890.1 hypothetical protein FRC15_007931 [Serendipita sp. 397]KAG8798199.1 hypothetical protein FRC16_007738 [Serendipita sp. 398]KAG8848966.1 hypothetical protein FRC20_002411 [Serendipita sp. 405]